jgi:zinc transport system substrate-binding protein
MAIFMLALTSCGQSQGAAPSGTPRVVATVFPLAWIAQQIAPHASITFLGRQGREPHDLELSPADREAIDTADIVLYVGDIGFQPQIEAAVRSRKGKVVSIASVIGGKALRTSTAHAHGDDQTSAIDPHMWLDAGLMASVTEWIGQAFAAIDPSHHAAYRANAAELGRRLTALDAEIARILSSCQFKEAITSHEAYAYLLRPRGLAQRGIAGADPEAGASPARLAELTEKIRTEGIPAVLAEPVEGRTDAEALTRESGVELLEINPLEVVTDREYQTGYPTLLRQQAETFAKALRCAGARDFGVESPRGQDRR